MINSGILNSSLQSSWSDIQCTGGKAHPGEPHWFQITHLKCIEPSLFLHDSLFLTSSWALSITQSWMPLSFPPGQWDLTTQPRFPSFCRCQKGGWVFKVSCLCKCWCIGHSCFSEKAFRGRPFPLFPSSWEWYINWPQQEKRSAWGLGPLTSVKRKVTVTASVWALEQKPQAQRPSGLEGGWWERVGV